MTARTATRLDHEAFCVHEGWQKRRDARGRTGTHHVGYELALPDGRVLRTRISQPVDRSDYGPSLFAHILRDQLEVTEQVFWACAEESTLPDRGGQTPSAAALPAEMVYLLIHRVGVPEREVATLDLESAVARLNRYWTEGP